MKCFQYTRGATSLLTTITEAVSHAYQQESLRSGASGERAFY